MVMKKVTWTKWKKQLEKGFLLIAANLSVLANYAQDANAGINEANTKVRSYFASGTNLLNQHCYRNGLYTFFVVN